MNKHSKRDCINLIKDKELPYEIKRIGQTSRLVSKNPIEPNGRKSVSEPIFSWDRLYEKLEAMESQDPAVASELLKEDEDGAVS